MTLSILGGYRVVSIHPHDPYHPIDYEIQIATEDDREEILNFLQTFFFRDEPINSYLGLISDDRPRSFTERHIGEGLAGQGTRHVRVRG
ncbi:hypothetical protein NQ317_004507 [Molorchus minor]|uniref:Uncharacterized protein n=1 Tax=Molorchus minor TaxID=1323400 RepID=A0ABQ9JZM3_9CUCU|nr:hypothetical protein NQ317_004507 [Molorchus minor]